MGGETGERPCGQHTGIAQRLVHAGGPGGEGFLALGRRHHQFVVLGADRFGHAARIGALIVAAVVDPHAEGREPATTFARGKRGDQSQIDMGLKPSDVSDSRVRNRCKVRRDRRLRQDRLGEQVDVDTI